MCEECMCICEKGGHGGRKALGERATTSSPSLYPSLSHPLSPLSLTFLSTLTLTGVWRQHHPPHPVPQDPVFAHSPFQHRTPVLNFLSGPIWRAHSGPASGTGRGSCQRRGQGEPWRSRHIGGVHGDPSRPLAPAKHSKQHTVQNSYGCGRAAQAVQTRHTYTHTHTHTYIYTHTHTHTYILTHTHIHIYSHTHTYCAHILKCYTCRPWKYANTCSLK